MLGCNREKSGKLWVEKVIKQRKRNDVLIYVLMHSYYFILKIGLFFLRVVVQSV